MTDAANDVLIDGLTEVSKTRALTDRELDALFDALSRRAAALRGEANESPEGEKRAMAGDR